MSAAVVVDGAASARDARGRFPGCVKLESWLYLHVLGLPTVAGVVFDGWSPDVDRRVRDFASRFGVTRLTVRSDAAQETGTYPHGGYTVAVEDMPGALAPFLDLHRVVYLLEPIRRLATRYCLGVLQWSDGEPAEYEVMGPGFDISDLKHGAFVPHESFRVPLDVPVPTRRDLLGRRTVGDAQYRESWHRRLAKIGSFASVDPTAAVTDATAELEQAGRDHLLQLGETLLLDHPDAYVPIPHRLVAEVHRETSDLAERLAAAGAPGRPLVISLSYALPGPRRVYWDVVWPQLKYTGATGPAGSASGGGRR